MRHYQAGHAPGDFARLRDRLFEKEWVVYSKRPFAGPEQVFSYLGRYTHRVGISNHRILSVSDNSVTIDTRDGKKDRISREQPDSLFPAKQC